jgi:hypothetical protein
MFGVRKIEPIYGAASRGFPGFPNDTGEMAVLRNEPDFLSKKRTHPSLRMRDEAAIMWLCVPLAVFSIDPASFRISIAR